MTKSVWVTRPEPGATSTANALRKAGYSVIAAPLLAVTTPSPLRIPSGPWPDWLILVSANAVHGFSKAIEGPSFPTRSASVRVAAVGEVTAQAAREAGWQVELVPEVEHGAGLARALAKLDVKGRRVWVPGGNRKGSASRDLPDALALAGAKVESFEVYATEDRVLTKDEIKTLGKAAPGAVVLHSPSAVEAAHHLKHKAVRQWLTESALVAIGPTTEKRARELDYTRVHVCVRPNDASLIDVLAGVPGLGQG